MLNKPTPDFQAFNKNLAGLQIELSQVRHELDELKAGELAQNINEQDSNVYIVPKKPDTGELRRQRFYLHERISERFSESELISLMYSIGINPGAVSGETHNDQCLSLVMYCERHGYMPELMNKVRQLRPRYDWII